MRVNQNWAVVALVLSLLLAGSGCASIVRGGRARVEIETLPSGATVWVDGQLHGKTPLAVTLSRDEQHSVRLALDGHEEVTIQTDKQLTGRYVLLDLVVGLVVIGLVVDAITGAWYEPGPRPLRVLLSPRGERCATGDCAYLRAPREGSRP